MNPSEPRSETGRPRLGPWLAAAVLLLMAAVALWVVLGPSPTSVGHTEPVAQVRAFAGIPPVAYLVERIGGNRVRVDTLVSPGQDPHLFEPTPHQVMALGRADLFFKTDMPFENRLIEHLTARGRGPTVVDTTVGVVRRRMAACGCGAEPGHDHDEHEEHGTACTKPGEPDPHVWLAPRALRAMAASIAEALCHADSAGSSEYEKNLAALDADLDALDRRIRQTLAPFRGQSFLVFHPAFGYFGDAYGLKQEAVEVEGKSPTPKQLRALVHKARSEGTKVVFLQPQFDPRSADAVAQAINGAAWPMDALAKDVLGNLDDVATKIAASLDQPRRKAGLGTSYAASEDDEHVH